MPLLKGTRYKYRTTKTGKQRLAFLNGKVIEVKGTKNRRGYVRRIE